MMVRTVKDESNSWFEFGFTYEELTARVGCSDRTIRKLVAKGTEFKLEEGKRGKNGSPAIIWMNESAIKSLVSERLYNKQLEDDHKEKRGRKSGTTSITDLYSPFISVDTKINLFKLPKKIKRFNPLTTYTVSSLFYATDGTVCRVLDTANSNFFVSKTDGEFGKVAKYTDLCGECLIQSTEGKLYSVNDVYYVEISQDGSVLHPIWIRQSKRDVGIIAKE